MYFSPTNYLWIVGTITSFEKKDEYHNEFIKLSINVEKALGSELFPEHEIQIVLAYPGRRDFTLKDYGLQESKTYLFALKQCTELHQLSTEERIYSFLSFPSYILEVYDNSISKKNKVIPIKTIQYDTITDENIYDFFFDSNQTSISINDADKKLTDFINVKR